MISRTVLLSVMTMATVPLGSAALCSTGCGATSTSASVRDTAALAVRLDSDLASMEEEFDRHDQALAVAEADAAALVLGVQEVAQLYREAADNYAQAEDQWNASRDTLDAASEEFLAASAAYRDAADYYRYAATALIVIASLPLENYGVPLCDEMSASRLRARLRAQGVPLDGLDVDHVVARAVGGRDHPLNYQLLPESVNRSLQEGGLWEKFQMAPLNVLVALGADALARLLCE